MVKERRQEFKTLYFNLIVPVILFFLTLCTTIISGVLISGNEYLTFSSVWNGIPYSIGALIILGAHTLGHYLQARLCKIKVNTPYFIPALGFIGTMGAYTKLQWPVSDRRVLIKIFASGPICGFFAAWIVLIIGLFFSTIVDISPTGSPVKMGDSIIMAMSSFMIFGNLPVTKDIMLHPLAYAGCLGLFFNFCHLLPIGRFDGGRLTYALWGYQVTLWVSFISIAALLIFGYFSSDWTIWFCVALVGAISTIRLRDQYAYERYDQPLAKSMLLVLSILAAILAVSFTPIPLPIFL